MKLVFMGTPDFAVPTLQALVKNGHEVVGVFTQPDRPAGRGKNLRPSPVKVAAQELGLPVFQPEKVKTLEAIQQLKELGPQVIIVVAYGQILSKEILGLPPYGCINVHASLLPDLRGAAPIHWALIHGEKKTGVTTMQMDEGLDTGDMLLKAEYPISDDATTGEVHDALARIGGELLIKTLNQLEKGELQATPQVGETRYASLLKRAHEELNWSRSTKALHNQIRGLNPWPGAYTTFRGETLKVWKSKAPNKALKALGDPITAQAGEIREVLSEGLLVQTGDGVLIVTEVQPAGKKVMLARDFFLGRRGQVGDRFGDVGANHSN
jgi:methionyl-tRNA formyltransferase